MNSVLRIFETNEFVGRIVSAALQYLRFPFNKSIDCYGAVVGEFQEMNGNFISKFQAHQPIITSCISKTQNVHIQAAKVVERVLIVWNPQYIRHVFYFYIKLSFKSLST